MEEQTTPSHEPLANLAHAAKALLESVESALDSEPIKGAAQMLLKSYRALHRKASELLPDEYHITEGLALEIEEDASDHQILAQVRMAARQLRSYLREMLPSEGPDFHVNEFHFDLPQFGTAAEGFARGIEAKARKLEARLRKFEARAQARAEKMEAKAEARSHKIAARMEKLQRKLEQKMERKKKRGQVHIDFEDPYDDPHEDHYTEIH